METKKILIVEDSPTQAQHLYALLEDQGFKMFWACQGIEGVQMARQSQPDLIILDLQMPKMNGFEACRKLKEYKDTANIPIIVFTNLDEADAVSLCMELGIADYIPKDVFADAVLLESLRQMGWLPPDLS